MTNPHRKRPAFPATRRVTAADAAIGDFVIVGQFKGFCIEETQTSGDLNGTCLIAFGEFESVHIAGVSAGGGVSEGDFLKYDGTLDGGDGGFTDDGASATDFDAIAGLGVSVADGGTGTGDVVIPAPY